ncbi:nucleotide-diphospho-sugar transferase [Mollisia scopiformis]|uniref:Nucleotide-diphospho-sugar transferase n=1 Tax=Mollisia scopiformis TaxID=149040 RepID=A0A194X0W0_MOLSC|nr:nucleotide-diphospho-sugar transferase [Mollisia scopiformis]KUJ13836.1 nucleotide-diphospho-sugar transferase [Mollisia scopiformis]
MAARNQPPRLQLSRNAAGDETPSSPSSEYVNPFADPEGLSSSGASSIRSGQVTTPAQVHLRERGVDDITPAPAPTQPQEEFNEKIEYTQPPPGLPTGKDPEKQGKTPAPASGKKKNFFARQWAVFRATYAPVEDAPLILPSGTTDKEKYSYLKTNRLPLYIIGVFSFLSLSAGMWLFVITSKYFYWFGFFVGLLEIYLIISYTITIVGKDYDFEGHKKILADHPILPETAPTVDIYLPCCKEPMEILANTYKYVQALQWPEGKLKVYVLDDGGMDAVKELATSFGFNYIVRDDRPRLKKAGNLRWAFSRTQGDFFTIFDADFCPRPDFLHELIPQHLADPKTAIVQSPQFFRVTDNQTWVEQGAGGIQELFYRVVEVNRNRWGASICVGSNAVYRREALVEVGGTAEIGFSEDVHTGFYAVNRGWKVKYVPLCLACGVCPDTPHAFFSQQMRWCMGSTTLLTNPDFWRSKLSIVQKLCYCSGMMYYSAISLTIFLNPLPGILLLWVRPEYFKYYNLAFAIPSIFYSLFALRFWAKAKYSLNVQFIMVIQSYAYFTAIKDRLFGRALAWVPSGDNAGHKNNKFRNMRILAWCWIITYLGALAGALVYRCLKDDDFHIYNAVPLMVLDSMNLFFAHRFLLCVKKK